MHQARRILGVLLLGLGLTLAGGAGAEGPLEGMGILTKKDLVASTVTIDGQVYRVKASTEIRDLEGDRIELDEVEVADGTELDVMYEFSAVKTAAGLELDSLRMTRPVE